MRAFKNLILLEVVILVYYFVLSGKSHLPDYEMNNIYITLLLSAQVFLMIYLFGFSFMASSNAHIKTIIKLRSKVAHWRKVYAGEVLPHNTTERDLLKLSEYDFERRVVKLYNTYPGAYLVARASWSDYLRRLDKRALALRYATESPTPHEAKVIYLEPQSVTTPTPIGEGENVALIHTIREAKRIPITSKQRLNHAN